MLREELLARGGLPWEEARALAYEEPGVYSLRVGDELHLIGPKGLLARLDLNGILLWIADEEVWDEEGL
ncbi:hypothetical protein [Thermus caldifontis]|uniref:hypothetical protein n=1 Tax=Thermus caldifontis TaxID=1930763 RepID=UPI000DF293E8|nr:hypothetical protein [Thermus caldifontis]